MNALTTVGALDTYGLNRAEILAAASAIDPAPPAFIPSATFRGSRRGYVFKNGASGQGYYVDDQRQIERAREDERRRQAEDERRRQAEDERRRQAENERKRKAEDERKRKAEDERKRQLAEDERKRQLAEIKRQQDERVRAQLRSWKDVDDDDDDYVDDDDDDYDDVDDDDDLERLFGDHAPGPWPSFKKPGG
jgi:hypothetical protein